MSVNNLPRVAQQSTVGYAEPCQVTFEPFTNNANDRIAYVRRIGIGSRVVSVLDSGAVGPGFKSQPRRCRVTVLDKLFTPIVPLFTKQRNW